MLRQVSDSRIVAPDPGDAPLYHREGIDMIAHRHGRDACSAPSTIGTATGPPRQRWVSGGVMWLRSLSGPGRPVGEVVEADERCQTGERR